jgi:lipid-A-disaccharide synthase
MVSCGEPSGDLYAGALVAALRTREPAIEVFGFGGDHLAAAGARLVGNFQGHAVTGLTEALSVLPRSLALYGRLVAAARASKPAVLVVVDYPDFNFRLMRAIKRLGVPVVYYVCPQLWAWRPRRIKLMKALVDRALPIFPCEEELYRREGMDVRFVGHPLIDLARPTTSREAFRRKLRLDTDAPLLALLPGSRPNELEKLAPIMAAAIPKIAAQVPGVQFVVARAPHLGDGLFDTFGIPGMTALRIVENQTDDVLQACDAVVTASGTATVQTALHGKPMVVLYKLSPMTYRLGKRLARVSMYAMVNLIAGDRIVTELIQDACTPEAVADEAVSLFTDSLKRARMIDRLADVRARLGGPGASERAAEAILDVVHSTHAS